MVNQKTGTENKRLIFLGPPGSGKGTQGNRVAKRFNLDFISTGDILREEIKERSEIGKRVNRYVEEGKLVPDELMIELVQKRVVGREGFILDGFPRTLEQAKGLQGIISIDKVIYFNCDEDTIVRRLSARRICPVCAMVYNLLTHPPSQDELCDDCGEKLEQREDDRESVVRKRIELYKRHTLPLLDFYRPRLRVIEGDSGIEEVYERVKRAIVNNG